MVLINKIFVVLLLASLVGIMAFSVTSDYLNEYDVLVDDSLGSLNESFTQSKTTTTNYTNELSSTFSANASTTDRITGYITAGYTTFTGLLGQMSVLSDLLTVVQTELEIPAYVTGVLFAIILISFIVALALILMRLVVF